MHSQLLSQPCSSSTSPGGWKARSHARMPRPCGSPSSCGIPARLPAANAVAGVGVQVPSTTNSRSGSPSTRGGSPSTSYSGSPSSSRAMNAPLQMLVRAAAEARVVAAAPAELSEVSSRLATTQSWPALQVLALQYQGRLDQHTIVAVLRRGAQLAAGASAPPSASEQYACARFLESVAMSCASLIPTMTPPTVAAMLATLGALATSGLVARQVPSMVVMLVQALILASLPQLHNYSGPQLAYLLRGCALLSPGGLPEVWLDEWQAVTTGPTLADMPPDALAAVVASLQALYSRQNWMPQDRWLTEMLQVVESKLGAYDGQGLRDLAIALAGLEVRPHTGWVGNFRAAFDPRVAAAELDPHDVAGVLFAFTKLEVAFA